MLACSVLVKFGGEEEGRYLVKIDRIPCVFLGRG